MPTNKTPFTFHIEGKLLEKMRFIARRDTRSWSNLLEHICKLYVEKYEGENGECPADHNGSILELDHLGQDTK